MKKILLAVLIVGAVAALALPVFARGGFGCRSGCGPGWQSAKAQEAPAASFNCGGPCGGGAQAAAPCGGPCGGQPRPDCPPDCPNLAPVPPVKDGAAK